MGGHSAHTDDAQGTKTVPRAYGLSTASVFTPHNLLHSMCIHSCAYTAASVLVMMTPWL